MYTINIKFLKLNKKERGNIYIYIFICILPIILYKKIFFQSVSKQDTNNQIKLCYL